MRLVGAALLALMAAVAILPSDQAFARKPKPSEPAEAQVGPPTADKPTTGPLRATYSAMPLAERVGIQSDLIWTGDYNGVTDGEFGDRSIAAVKAFQKRNGGKETGVLTTEERDKLRAAARPRVEQVGWQMIDDQPTGARIGLPTKLVPKSSPGKAGSHWQSTRGEIQVDTFRIAAKGITLTSALEQVKKEPTDRTVAYTVTKPDFFVVSGLQSGVKKFYVRAHVANDEVRGISILYDQAMEGIVEKVVIAMSSAFTPFPTAEIAAEIQRTAPPRRKVDYGTGVIVSAAGDIVTDRQVIDDCAFIVIPGLGNADRIADDKPSNLALLRVYGARSLPPLAIASESGRPGDVTLVGVADPQAQAGGSSVSTARARINTARVVEPSPAPGFSGAAAIDSEGQLAGLVQTKPQVVAGPATTATANQATIVSVETLRDFLKAQKLTPASGRSSADSVKTSVVRVICVRR